MVLSTPSLSLGPPARTPASSLFPLSDETAGRASSGPFGHLVVVSRQAPVSLPAKREGAESQLPVTSHGRVVPDLVVAEAQGLLDLLLSLLHPHPHKTYSLTTSATTFARAPAASLSSPLLEPGTGRLVVRH